MRSPRVTSTMAVAVVLAISAAGCSSSGESQPSKPAPVGIIALGHAGLNAYNSDPTLPGQPALKNSWATGSSAEVDSVYLRLVAARPATKGHVFNAAFENADVNSLAAQAKTALAKVPAPALIIIETIDIHCDGTDAANVPVFGATLLGVLKSLNASSPESKILLVGPLGRPNPVAVTALVDKAPYVKKDLSGAGICDSYDEHGQLNKAAFRTETKIIDSYEAEQARVCSSVVNCRTDGGVRADYQDTLENFSSDWNHLNARGQAQAAKIIWPVVASELELN
jgi:hypothetical protein